MAANISPARDAPDIDFDMLTATFETEHAAPNGSQPLFSNMSYLLGVNIVWGKSRWRGRSPVAFWAL